MVLEQETLAKFGYTPSSLAPSSHKLVIVLCERCQQQREVKFWVYRNGALCRACTNKTLCKDLLGNYARQRKKYNSRAEMNKAKNRRAMRKILGTEKGKIINRLRAALHDALVKGKRLALHELPYSKEQLVSHVQRYLAACAWTCPMCLVTDLHNGYDIDHKIPLSSAGDARAVVELFSLENLGVLCPNCNRYVKGAIPMVY